METKEILAALKQPFHPDDLQWRIGQAGNKNGKTWAMVLAYIDDRAIQDRLDEVVGAENWQISYEGMNGDATTATISIKLDGEWVSKSNGAGATDIEAIKGGYSGASKRAASVWGIGRYLYNLKNNWAVVVERGANKSLLKGGDRKNSAKTDIWYNWNPPDLPSWAMPTTLKQTPDNFAYEIQGFNSEIKSCKSGAQVQKVATDWKERIARWCENDKAEARKTVQHRKDEFNAGG